MPSSFEITTPLAAPAEKVWRGAVDPVGINFELGPWVSMTMPKGIQPGMTIEDASVGEVLGRSWIRVLGCVPVDFDDLCLAERGPGMRFLERSELGSASVWQHEREVVTTGEATCEITDRLDIEVRAPLRAIGGARLAPQIVRVLFTHRHKRLAERWGQ
ncbi:MAG: hypothetical protein WKF62_08995 [Solirubrobacterales bacterium]